MTNYVIGRMVKGEFVGSGIFLSVRDAAVEESQRRLQGQRGLKIAELESVAEYKIKNDLKVSRDLTNICRTRIADGEYIDHEGLLVYVMGWEGVPYIVGQPLGKRQFNGVSVHQTLRKADNARHAADRGVNKEDGIEYRILQMRVVAWITVDDDLTVVRSALPAAALQA